MQPHPNKLLFNISLTVFLISSLPSYAEPYTPQSADTVIAQWPAKNSLALAGSQQYSLASAVSLSENLLARASQPGQSYLYGFAETLLQRWIKKGRNDNPQLWVNWARVLQHKHDFTQAEQALESALRIQAGNVNAHFLRARIGVVQQDYAIAKRACDQIVKAGDLLGGNVCHLEVASHQGQLSQSYQSLSTLASNLPEDQIRIDWVRATLADMAARQGLWVDSEKWLDASVDDNDLSSLIEWADVKLKLKKYQEVDSKLSAVVQSIPSSEDALFVRLALAEKGLGNSVVWKQRVTARMMLREQREDLFHASDLAIFYLDIEPMPKEALRWAEINWQQAKEYKDKELLERARQVADDSFTAKSTSGEAR